MQQAPTERVLLSFTKSLWNVIDIARGETGRAAWLEEVLWKCPRIRQTAKEVGIEQNKRRTRKLGEEEKRDVRRIRRSQRARRHHRP